MTGGAQQLAAAPASAATLTFLADFLTQKVGPWLWNDVGPWISEKLLAPAVVAVVFTGITNSFLERRKATRDLTTKVADSLREDLKGLQALAVDYWSRRRADGDAVVEARITAGQDEVLEALSLLADEFHLSVSQQQDLQPELLDSLTGGDFGTADRLPDPGRVQRVTKVIGNLRSNIIRLRSARLRRSGR